MPSPIPTRPPAMTPVFSNDYLDLTTPGVVVELTPDQAEALGAFEEDALSADEAWDANPDVGAL
jgi:hypothetical protein